VNVASVDRKVLRMPTFWSPLITVTLFLLQLVKGPLSTVSADYGGGQRRAVR